MSTRLYWPTDVRGFLLVDTQSIAFVRAARSSRQILHDATRIYSTSNHEDGVVMLVSFRVLLICGLLLLTFSPVYAGIEGLSVGASGTADDPKADMEARRAAAAGEARKKAEAKEKKKKRMKDYYERKKTTLKLRSRERYQAMDEQARESRKIGMRENRLRKLATETEQDRITRLKKSAEQQEAFRTRKRARELAASTSVTGPLHDTPATAQHRDIHEHGEGAVSLDVHSEEHAYVQSSEPARRIPKLLNLFP